MACDYCRDPESGESCFPHYGLAPHAHVGQQIIGSTVFTGEKPENFIEDPNEPGCGIYFCPKCGEGKQKAEQMIRQEKSK